MRGRLTKSSYVLCEEHTLEAPKVVASAYGSLSAALKLSTTRQCTVCPAVIYTRGA